MKLSASGIELKNHKLDEWREMAEVIKGLPYAEELILVRGE